MFLEGTMDNQSKTVVLTGGGTVGHVTLNKLLIPEFINEGYTPVYIGSKNGLEKEMISELNIAYKQISSGKLRRYLSLENVLDIFRVGKGVIDSFLHLRKLKPRFVFSKGGFVSVPVVIASRLLGIPVYIHESDLTPGLANKIAAKFATEIYVTFRITTQFLPENKTHFLGPVIREDLRADKSESGYQLTGFNHEKPVMLVMGGSQGARVINELIRSNIDTLTKTYQIIHLCGKGNLDLSIDHNDYRQYEFVTTELAALLSIADIVVGRSGANAIFEYLLSKKPMILIPLPASQSRGDQIENARYFEQQRVATVIKEDELNIDTLQQAIQYIDHHRVEMVGKMQQYKGGFTPLELVNRLTAARR